MEHSSIELMDTAELDRGQEAMLTDKEIKSFDSASVPIVGKRSSNGIILDSLDTNKILALEDSNEDELLHSMGSPAQRTRTPRSSVEQARVKIVRLSNGDLDGGSRYMVQNKENSTAGPVYRTRQRNSTELSSTFRQSMNFDDDCTTPKGELSMSLTPDSIIGMEDISMDNGGTEPVHSLEDPTVAITRERATLVSQRHRDFGRSETLTHENAERLSSIKDIVVKEETISEENFVQTLTRDHTQKPSDSDGTISLSRLDSLSEELQKALSQISSTPEMSMATLLDMKENSDLNERFEKSGSENSSLDDLELDEATISAYTIRNCDLYGSSTSIPSLFMGTESFSSTCSSPPDNPSSPEHSLVPLRPSSGGRSRARNRMGNADFDSIATGCSDDSCEVSPSHFAREVIGSFSGDSEQALYGIQVGRVRVWCALIRCRNYVRVYSTINTHSVVLWCTDLC